MVTDVLVTVSQAASVLYCTYSNAQCTETCVVSAVVRPSEPISASDASRRGPVLEVRTGTAASPLSCEWWSLLSPSESGSLPNEGSLWGVAGGYTMRMFVGPRPPQAVACPTTAAVGTMQSLYSIWAPGGTASIGSATPSRSPSGGGTPPQSGSASGTPAAAATGTPSATPTPSGTPPATALLTPSLTRGVSASGTAAATPSSSGTPTPSGSRSPGDVGAPPPGDKPADNTAGVAAGVIFALAAAAGGGFLLHRHRQRRRRGLMNRTGHGAAPVCIADNPLEGVGPVGGGGGPGDQGSDV